MLWVVFDLLFMLQIKIHLRQSEARALPLGEEPSPLPDKLGAHILLSSTSSQQGYQTLTGGIWGTVSLVDHGFISS